MSLIYRQFDLRIFFIGQFLTAMGLGAWMTSAPLYLLGIGDQSQLPIYATACALSAAVGTPLFAPLADRGSRRRTLSIALACLAALFLVRALLLIGANLTFTALLVIDSAAAATFGVIQPLQQSLAATAARSEVASSNIATQRAIEAFCRMVAPFACGAFASYLGAASVFVLIPALFLISSASFNYLPNDELPSKPKTLAGWVADFRAGISVRTGIKPERDLTVVGFLLAAMTAPLVGTIFPMALGDMGKDVLALGLLQSSYAAGSIIGFTTVRPAFNDRLSDYQLAVGSVAVAGLVCAAWSLAGSIAVICVLGGLMGTSIAVAQIALQTNRLLAAPSSFRGRMAATSILISQLGAVAGNIALGVIGTAWGGSYAVMICAALLLLVSLLLASQRSRFSVLLLSPESANGYYEKLSPGHFRA